MLSKPLKEEQADMKARWSDPSYRWINDPEIRRRYAKEFRNDADRKDIPNTLPNAGHKVKQRVSSKTEEGES
jgi:hypothetical protein